jgi:hypothetical protein
LYAYKTAQYTKEANVIAEQQTILIEQQKEIAQQQTDILDKQTEIQYESLQFEKDKNRTDTAKVYRETMSQLFDKVYGDEIYKAIYVKIKS